MKDLKVYGIGDGRNRIIIATKTKKEAYTALKMSSSHFSKYSSVTGNKEELELALNNPNKLFMKPNQAPNSEYKEAEAKGSGRFVVKD